MSDLYKTGATALITAATSLSDGVSTQLMYKCMQQEKTPFTLDDIKYIDPTYEITIKEMTKAAALQSKQSGKPIVVDLEHADNADYQYKEKSYRIGEEPEDIDSISDLLPSFSDKQESEKRRDIARALGNVVVFSQNGRVLINDYFDFEKHENCKNDDSECLFHAAVTAMGDGDNSSALRAFGRMYCKEGKKNAPTNTSIPIEIIFSE